MTDRKRDYELKLERFSELTSENFLRELNLNF